MNKSFIEVDSCQITKSGQRICGDVFLMDRLNDSGRIVTTLSDGMGSGVKANVLANLTAGMGQRFALADADLQKSAETILNTLPVCRERKISYATFTILDIKASGFSSLVEYDNPPLLWIRDGRILPIDRDDRALDRQEAFRPEIVNYSKFQLEPEDRLIFCSDGVSQSGMGSPVFPLGWREKGVETFLQEILKEDPGISAHDLATKVARKAVCHDGYKARDDISCVVVYVRKPRKLLLVTGPPFDEKRDVELASRLAGYPGRKVISGGTTATIVSREWGRPVTVNLSDRKPGVPPSAQMEGADLVTEGMLTLGRTAEILENREMIGCIPSDPAEKLATMLLDSDEVSFLVGTRINEAHHDPTLPFELGIRRTLIDRLRRSLENLYLKKTDVSYV